MTQEVNDTMIKSTVPADDADFMGVVAPLGGRGITIGWVEEIHGEGGKATQTVVTRAEIETLVTDYFDRLKSIYVMWMYYGQVGSSDIREKPYMWRRINDFIEAGAISEEKVTKLRDKFLAEFDSPEAVEQERQRCRHMMTEPNEQPACSPSPQSDALDKGATK